MIFLPTELLGNYLKGAREANSDNWNDLNNYNTVENGIMRNRLLKDTFNDLVNTSHAGAQQNMNNATRSNLDLQTYSLGQPGRNATAGVNSDYQTDYAYLLSKDLPAIAANVESTTVDNSAYNRDNIAYLRAYQKALWEQRMRQQQEEEEARKRLNELLNKQNAPANTPPATTPQAGAPDLIQQLHQLGGGLQAETPTDVSVGGATYRIVRDNNNNVYTVDANGNRQLITPGNSLFSFKPQTAPKNAPLPAPAQAPAQAPAPAQAKPAVKPVTKTAVNLLNKGA